MNKLFLLVTLTVVGCAPLGKLDPIEAYSKNTQPIFESDPGAKRIGDGAKRLATGAIGDPIQAGVELVVGLHYFPIALLFGGPSQVAEAATFIAVGVARPFRGVGYVGIGIAEIFYGMGEALWSLSPFQGGDEPKENAPPQDGALEE